jgi:hypothetical protein
VSVPSVVVLFVMAAIFVVSVLGGNPDPRSAPASELAWAGLLLIVGLLELALIVTDNPTLSSQMQYWTRRNPVGVGMVVFWGWLGFHFVIEPIVRVGVAIVERLAGG